MKLRGAIIGFGEVARNGHWPGYAANGDVEIVAVVDRTAGRRELADTLCPGIATYSTLADVPRSAAIDFVDICTPPALHGEPMLDAIGRGWHVLCEKPFLLDTAVLAEARVGAAAANVAVIPVHNWKYAPIVQAATAALRAGAIGSLRRIEIETSRLKAAPTAEPGGVNWRRDPAIAGGGILMDHGWHSVYIALHWFGEQAIGVSATLHWPDSDGSQDESRRSPEKAHDSSRRSAVGAKAEDEARVAIEFPSGSAAIMLTWNGTVRTNVMRLEGAHGEIVVDDGTLHVRGAETRTQTFDALSAGSAHADWFEAMLPDVLAGFRNPQQSRTAFEEAAQTLDIIKQAYASNQVMVGAAAKS